MDVNKGEVSGDFINHPTSHFAFFNKISTDPFDDYAYYPRGRIIYNRVKDIYLIYVDALIYKSKDWINQIVKEYNLSSVNTQIKRDEHYKHYEK